MDRGTWRRVDHRAPRWLPWAVLTVALALIATAIVVLRQPDRTSDGFVLGGLPAGDLTRDEVVTLVSDRTRQDADAVVMLRTEQASLPVALRDTGLVVDVEASAGAALEASRLAERSDEADLVVTVDQARLDAISQTIATKLSTPEFHGDLVFRDGRLESVPARAGLRVQPADVQDALRTAASTFVRSGGFEVEVAERVLHVTPEELQAALVEARALLETGVTLRRGSATATVRGVELQDLVTVTGPPGEADHDLDLTLRRSPDREALATRLATELSDPAIEPVATTPPLETELTTKGDVTWDTQPATVTIEGTGRPGVTIATQTALTALVAGVRDGGVAVVPAVAEAPRRTRADLAQIDTLLGSFTTFYSCCPPRVTNIKRLAEVIDGTLIDPGEQFSLNGLAGERTRAKGYVSAPFILDGELAMSVGGGISQFATSTFNAAFFAGLPIDEYKAHSFYISRYPAGREATVNFPNLDLKWTNDTGGPILVRTKATNTSITVALFGKDTGRTVEGDTGARRSRSVGGFSINVTRTISEPGKPDVERTFRTVYNAPPEDD